MVVPRNAPGLQLPVAPGPTATLATNDQPYRVWTNCYAAQLVAGDAVGCAAGFVLARLVNRDGLSAVSSVSYIGGCAALVAGWVFALYASGSYDVRQAGAGAEEFKRVLRGTATLIGSLAVVCVVADIGVSRWLIIFDLPLALAVLLLLRYVGRRTVQARRIRGQWSYRILAVGSAHSVRDLAVIFARAPQAGLTVVAACVDGLAVGTHVVPGVAVVGGIADAAELAADVDANVVAVAGLGLGSRTVRELGWAMEGTDRQLVMAPELTEVAGPRVHVSPVQGLPLMWVDQPQFTGFSRLVKRALDVVGSLALLALSSPLLLIAAVAVKVTSHGPAFFSQVRLGKDGAPFRMFKFRTMVADAESRRADFLHLNESADVRHLYFKIKQDPRITQTGRWLRRASLDELPQLLNVLQGHMSLVGPRPLPGELEEHQGDFLRRLRVKPGLTGLWQVSGRSELSAEDAVRLDLYYVENWTIALDLAILARTAWAVARSRGAY